LIGKKEGADIYPRFLVVSSVRVLALLYGPAVYGVWVVYHCPPIVALVFVPWLDE
jgi:hypothetical protein